MLRLHNGRDPRLAARAIALLAQGARNIEPASPRIDLVKSKYVQWVDTVEIQLRGVFLDPSAWERLYSERYWHIRDLGDASLRPWELIRRELETQASYLEALVSKLDRYADRLDAAPGIMAALDTHVLLHFQRPEDVDWRSFIDAADIRLVLPLRVLEELDEKKYGQRDDLAGRARNLLGGLRTLLAPTAGAPVRIRDGVTVEVPVDDTPRRRLADADQEILNVCLDLKAVGRQVLLVSDDAGITLRAAACKIEVVAMPEKYLRVAPRADLGVRPLTER